MDPLINRTLEKIKQEKIRPQPCWVVTWKSYLFWGIFVAMLVLAAVSISMAFHLAANMDWNIYNYVKQTRLAFILSVLPLFWIVLIFFFSFISYINIRHTNHGYRYHPYKLAGTIAGISLGLGAIFCVTQATETINESLAHRIGYFPYVMTSREHLWNQPGVGLLSGRIYWVDESQIDLVDFGGKHWVVMPDEHTMVMSTVVIREDEKIKVIGQQQDENVFLAKEIRPWECRTLSCQTDTSLQWQRVIRVYQPQP